MTAPVKTSLLLATLVACASAYAQTTMTEDEADARIDRIEATAKAEKEACQKMEGNAEDVCEAEAKAKEKIAKAEVEYQRSGKDGDRRDLQKMKAEGAYEVAKEKCEGFEGDRQSDCKKQAEENYDAAREAVENESTKR